MKKLLVLIGLTFMMGENLNAHSTSFYHRGSVAFFYSSLTPHGEWIEIEGGLYAWRPLHVRMGWRPYVYGRWAWTDQGWYWVSTEPFGWAVYHYGRWYYDDFYGWIWIPDNVWGPAWVEWRYNDDYVGWAPLPPYAHFSFSIGIRFSTHWVAPVHYWSFVRYRHFGSSVTRYVVDANYSRRLIRTTRSAGSYEVDRDRVINRGVDRGLIERRGRTRIGQMEIADVRERSTERIARDGSRERIEVYRPDRAEIDQDRDVRIDARRGDRRTTLDMSRIDRGSRELEPNSKPSDNDRRPIERRQKETEKSPEVTQPRERRPQTEFEKKSDARIPEVDKRSSQQRDLREIRRDGMPQYQKPQMPSPRMERQAPRSRQTPSQGSRGNQPQRGERKRGRD